MKVQLPDIWACVSEDNYLVRFLTQKGKMFAVEHAMNPDGFTVITADDFHCGLETLARTHLLTINKDDTWIH